MKFERLRLTGFKSFCDSAEFKIEPGLTGVVGPNGCGKSNLVEALRWVMGESSYKNMRASGMEDVIFSGSGRRPSRNNAEVGLVLSNSDRRAPAAFNDSETIEVTRRIERDNGSTYRVNGKEVRARDVQLLFADASTGARSPSLVRQGQIGEIISAKPQARRLILEEAAGVSGLHSRRHEAELRLKGAEDNLIRVEDVLKQIDAQVDSLKRQARQSNRYRELAGAIRRQEALARLIAWREHEAAFAEARRRLDADLLEVAERTRAQGEAARLQAIAAVALPPLREEEARRGAALHRIALAREALEAEEKRAKEREAELERRLAQFTGDLQREEALIADAAGVMDRLAAEEAALDAAGSASGRGCGAGARSRGERSSAASPAPRARWPRRKPRRPTSAPVAGRCLTRPERRGGASRALRRNMPRSSASAARSARRGLRRRSARRALRPWPRRSRRSPPPSAKRRRRRSATPRLARSRRATAGHWPRPSAPRRGWRRRRAPSRASSAPIRAARGRARSTRSASRAAMRRRLARRWATISTPRSTRRRRRIGRCSRRPTRIRRCRPAPIRSRRASPRRRRSPVAWRRSAWSLARRASGSLKSSSPASGWSRSKAISGAGTASSPPPKRRARPRGAWRKRTGSATLSAKPRRRARRQRRSASKRRARSSAVREAAAAEAEWRGRVRAARSASDAARDAFAQFERERAKTLSRLSAVEEAFSRAGAARNEAAERKANAEAALEELGPGEDVAQSLESAREAADARADRLRRSAGDGAIDRPRDRGARRAARRDRRRAVVLG